MLILLYIDINECNQGNGGCEHTCTDTIGSFTCSCNTGYQLMEEQCCSGNFELLNKYYLIVIDINECNSNNGGCNHTCINTVGSYVCQCNSGYTLSDSNNHSCIGETYM